MKKSELKEMIRQAMLEEVQSIPPHLYINNPDGEMDSPKRMINRYLGNLGVDYVKNPLATNNKHYVEGVENIEVMMSDGRYEEADQYAGEIADKISMLPSLEESISEDKKDKKEEEEDIEIEDIEGIEGIEDTEEIEDIPSSDASGITGDEKEVQDSLESALIAAKKLGDEKLINQIGNSITFFTRSHVVGSGEESLDEEIGGDNNLDQIEQKLIQMDEEKGENFNNSTEYGMDNYKDDFMWADYSDIGQYSIDPEVLDKFSGYDLYLKGKDVVKREYNGNVSKAYTEKVQSNMEDLYERKKMLKIAGIIK